MALLTKIEAAIALGVSIELLDWFIQTCPKPGETRKLVTIKAGNDHMINEDELAAFRQYLREPWPVKYDASRPSIPSKIKTDVKQESHLSCAICGYMDNGEVAHIEAVKKTYNNSPDNLIFLCPNHHTKFDLGFKPNSNVSEDEVRAAKLIKRQSRARIMRVEADVTRAYITVLDLIGKLEKKIDAAAGAPVSKVYAAEMKNLLKHSAKLGKEISKASKSGTAQSELGKHLNKHAPTIAKLSAEGLAATSTKEMTTKVRSLVRESREVIEALDEVDCPRCNGRGTTGLIGDWCKFCRGSQQVTQERADSYDPDDIDEQECPHCNGQGTTGLCGDYCAYCKGSQLVSSERATTYSPTDIDEQPCPRCNGNGTTGLNGDYCAYCHGSCVVSNKKWNSYDPDDIDEVECPRCMGQGTTGLNSDPCKFCKGSQFVSREKADSYNEDEIDEVECPHCHGIGTTGLNSSFCSYCKGSQMISSEKAARYDPNEIDEVICPHCDGQGTKGFAGDLCKLCKGEQTVTSEKAEEYEARKSRR
jgi:hypothetical protein